MRLSKEMQLELKEIPPAEFLAAVALVGGGTTLDEIIDFLEQIPPLDAASADLAADIDIPEVTEYLKTIDFHCVSDFARGLVNAPDDVNNADLREVAGNLFAVEYPELYIALETIFGAGEEMEI